jgi:hypothetical protein
MRPVHRITGLLLALAVATPAAAGAEPEAGFVPLFDGHSLKGWVNVNCAPSTFFVKDHEIITTGKPTGYLRTDWQYENFIAEFDWMHVPPTPDAVGNSGFFVWADPLPAVGTGYTRGMEVQVLVNLTYTDKKTGALLATSQGDLFSIWGATCVPDRPHPQGWDRCLPFEDRAKGANAWNHYRVEANDGRLTLAVNGKVVSGLSRCRPRKGYLALESEGSECHFRNLRIKELPSTHPQPDEVAALAHGHRSLYTGLDLAGWEADEETRKHWQPQDTVLHYDGKGGAEDRALHTEKTFGDAEFLVDFRLPTKEPRPCVFDYRAPNGDRLRIRIKPDGAFSLEVPSGRPTSDASSAAEQHRKALKPPGQWNRLGVIVKGKTLGAGEFRVTIDGKTIGQQKPVAGLPTNGRWELRPEGETDFTNLFVREF